MLKAPNENYLTRLHVFQAKAREHKQDVQSLRKTIRLQCEAKLQDHNVQHLLKTSTADARKHFSWENDTGKYSLGQDCIEQQAYELLLHLDETQSQGRKKGVVGFLIPGALATTDEVKPPTSENSPAKEDTVDKASTVRRELAEVERNAKSISEATLLQQAANMAVENALAVRIPGYSQQKWHTP